MNKCNRYLIVANRDVPIDSIEEVSFTATQTTARNYTSRIQNPGCIRKKLSNSVTFPTHSPLVPSDCRNRTTSEDHKLLTVLL